MGRGRAKAKQTKVARQLKYNSGGTDLDRLRAELIGASGSDHDGTTDVVEDEHSDAYSEWADDDEDDEDD